MHTLRRLGLYAPAIIVALAILYLSLLREVPYRIPAFSGYDKLAHALCYALLAALFTLGRYKDKAVGWTCTWLVIIIVSLYGGAIELLQQYCFPPRTGDWWDWAADIAGAGIGTLIIFLLWTNKRPSTT